jgi:hypothetical protein
VQDVSLQNVLIAGLGIYVCWLLQLGLFSFVTLLANQCQSEPPLRQAAWYVKPLPTFVDALALVRCLFWKSRLFQTSAHLTEVVKVPQELLNCWTDLLCYAA